ncbi:MAG TPA: hypothetical protein VFG50_00575 [Rhodothermales bacterium]|nr:hypothetical protein [Rhodothermales bacterium]
MNTVESGILKADDIGGAEQKGTFREEAGRIIVSGCGHGIGGSADSFTFCHVQAGGDFDLGARLHAVGMQNGDGAQELEATAGLVIRDGLEPGARSAALVVLPSGRAWLQTRVDGHGGTRVIGEPYDEIPFPMWIKLERRGPSFHAQASHDGLRWSHFASTEVEMGPTLDAGIALAGCRGAEAAEATFTDVYVEELPSGRRES